MEKEEVCCPLKEKEGGGESVPILNGDADLDGDSDHDGDADPIMMEVEGKWISVDTNSMILEGKQSSMKDQAFPHGGGSGSNGDKTYPQTDQTNPHGNQTNLHSGEQCTPPSGDKTLVTKEDPSDPSPLDGIERDDDDDDEEILFDIENAKTFYCGDSPVPEMTTEEASSVVEMTSAADVTTDVNVHISKELKSSENIPECRRGSSQDFTESETPERVNRELGSMDGKQEEVDGFSETTEELVTITGK